MAQIIKFCLIFLNQVKLILSTHIFMLDLQYVATETINPIPGGGEGAIMAQTIENGLPFPQDLG